MPWINFEHKKVAWKTVFKEDGFEILELTVGSKTTDRIAKFNDHAREELRGLVKVDFKAVGKSRHLLNTAIASELTAQMLGTKKTRPFLSTPRIHSRESMSSLHPPSLR